MTINLHGQLKIAHNPPKQIDVHHPSSRYSDAIVYNIFTCMRLQEQFTTGIVQETIRCQLRSKTNIFRALRFATHYPSKMHMSILSVQKRKKRKKVAKCDKHISASLGLKKMTLKIFRCKKNCITVNVVLIEFRRNRH